jgi:hypothetical protein
VEGTTRLEPGMAIRRLRSLYALLDDRRRPTSASRAGFVPPNSFLCWSRHLGQSFGLGSGRVDRRGAGRLRGSQAHDDVQHHRLLVTDRLERPFVRLDLVCVLEIPGRIGARIRMGDRSIDDGRNLAGERAGQGCGPHAGRRRHRSLPRLVAVAADQSDGSRFVALYVPDRHRARIRGALDPNEHFRVGALGKNPRCSGCRQQPPSPRGY